MEEEAKPFRDLAEGATRAALEFGKDSIVSLAQRFRNRELRFIQDEATIEEVRQERHSREYAGYEEPVRVSGLVSTGNRESNAKLA